MGFPEKFKIPVSDNQAYRQFGNAVVVPVVKEIAKSMVKVLRENKIRKTILDYA
jgi:DNA (cytosine-5)-methyltransferase 1